MKIQDQLLPYWRNLSPRDPEAVDTIVLHCTELPTLQMAREYGERIQDPETITGFSGHYYVDRDGTVFRYVPDGRTAHHVVGWNARTIGIEMVNSGRYPDWFRSTSQECTEPYPATQISGLLQLLRYLKGEHPVLRDLTRHSDLDTGMIPSSDDPDVLIRRKIDPGPLFPWDDVQRYWQELQSEFP